MPILKELSDRREGKCPYCYEGSLAYDGHSNLVFCKRCNHSVLIEGIEIKHKH